MKKVLASLTVLAIIATSTMAAIITVEDSASASNTAWQPTSIAASEFADFSLAGADKLVVTLAAQDSTIGSVTFDGKSMIKAVAHEERADCSVWYLDDPGTTTGDLEFTGASRGIAATFLALGGTVPGVGNTNSVGDTSTSLTTSADDSLVVASAGFITKVAEVAPTAESPLIAGPIAVSLYGDNYSTLSTAYQTVATAGTVTPTFDIADMTVAAEFEVIPEPASLALLTLVGGACFIIRRRFRR